MKLKYVGPKPIISNTRIEFDNNKEDKYVYLNIVVQLLKALDHNDFDNKTYMYNTDSQRLSDDELLDELQKYCSQLDTLMEHKNHETEEDIQHDIKKARENKVLSKEEKKDLETNINLMHDYLIQRSVNKSVYYCAIDSLAKLLEQDGIDYIITPMFESFAHVLQSLQSVLHKKNIPIETKLDIYQDDGKLLVKLQVKNT